MFIRVGDLAGESQDRAWRWGTLRPRCHGVVKLIALFCLHVSSGSAEPLSSLAEMDSRTPVSVVLGIDLSKWQRTVSFDEVRRAGVVYAFVKATQGATTTDIDYATNIHGARRAGLIVGSYHYYVTSVSAKDQLAHFTAVADVLPGDMPPVVDIEAMHNNNDAGLANDLRYFLGQLHAHYHVKPIIYSSRFFSNQHLKGLSDYPLWLAEYSTTNQIKLPLDWTTWTFWQHSEDGRLPGIQGNVDLNRFNGDLPALQSLLVKIMPAPISGNKASIALLPAPADKLLDR